MKSFKLLAIITLAGLGSCEKAKSIVKGFSEKKAAPSEDKSGATVAQSGALVSEVAEADFDSFSKQAGRVIVMDFYADWCGPCRQLAPILERIASEHQGKVLIGKVNVDNAKALASREGVRGIPDVRIFVDGKQVDKFVGLPPESEVANRIAGHAKGLPAVSASAADGTPAAEKEPSIKPMDKEWLPPGMERR
jgi:thioredoxin